MIMEEAESVSKNKGSSSDIDWRQAKEEREEYFEKLRKWLDEARLWYNVSAGFPYYFAGVANPEGASNNQQQEAANPYAAFYQTPLFQQNEGFRLLNNQQAPNEQQGQNANHTAFNGVPFYQTYPFMLPPNLLRLPTTYEFRIPPLWKRLCAELIDFCILFSLKLGLTFLFMESFSIGNALDLYGFDAIQKGLEGQELNYPLAFELVLLEFLHRVVVCAFEVFLTFIATIQGKFTLFPDDTTFLWIGEEAGVFINTVLQDLHTVHACPFSMDCPVLFRNMTYFLRGKMCATPGKRCMGLMVVTIDNLTLVPNRQVETVSATGVKALGWQRALLRSILKNLIVGLLLPLCVTFYVFPFNRTSYDMMSNSLVVEAHPEFLMYQNLIVI